MANSDTTFMFYDNMKGDLIITRIALVLK